MKTGPLAVRRHGIGVFMVRSKGRKDVWHTVSLYEPGHPCGQCSCEHFTFRLEPAISRHCAPNEPDCVHIRAVLAEIENARMLCECAGLQFSESIIPPFNENTG